MEEIKLKDMVVKKETPKNYMVEVILLFQMLFITLKLTGLIDYSWRFVFIPSYVFIVVLLVAIILTLTVIKIIK